MKICVTGGSGFIGSHLVQKLLEKGYDVSVLDLRKPVQDVEWIQKDVREDLGSVFADYTYVFHLAALANARKSSEDPVLCYDMNVKGTLNVLNAALKGDVERVLVASSSWVCGAQEGDMVNEKSPFQLEHINTIYGGAKIGQELLCFSFYSEYKGPKYTVFRYGIPYGERMWRGLVVRAFMEMAERAGILSIMGDGKQFREFMYVGDLADAHLHALKPDRREQDLQPHGRPPHHDRGDRQGGRQALPGQDRLHPPGAGRAQDQARPQLAGRERARLGAEDDARGRHPALRRMVAHAHRRAEARRVLVLIAPFRRPVL